MMKGFLWLFGVGSLLLFSACSTTDKQEVDRLNDKAYAYHYRQVDSVRVYAERALKLAGDYHAGKAEALNNLAFAAMVRMDYDKAYDLLTEAYKVTNNQVELLVTDLLQMRLCQRQSHNRDFYEFRERALVRLRRINEAHTSLTPHMQRRMVYARSEFFIVLSAYYYYVGLEQQSIDALDQIDPYGEIVQDTAQMLNYLYNVGAGGIITTGTKAEINQIEFDYLLRCYLMAAHSRYPFFEAQAMQAISEHLNNPDSRQKLIRDNLPAMKYINRDNMPDSLLAGNLAQRSLELFSSYGDTYQVAGCYRTLAECYWEIKDYSSALICLNNALTKDTVINRAPDLVASIREQLSLAYSAINDKPQSDYNRNIYLDLQEQTRQDRQLEARAEQLKRSSAQLNIMILAVVLMIVLVVVLLVIFDVMRRKSDRKFSNELLLSPLQEWKNRNVLQQEQIQTQREMIDEKIGMAQIKLESNKMRNLEQRAKLSLVNSLFALIDRIINEVNRLLKSDERDDVRQERYHYIAELTDSINETNEVLTHWIQMRQGDISVHVESFPLQELFDILERSRQGFLLKEISLKVEPTGAVVKADKTLTLFMLNTIADNARKYTAKGDEVIISSLVHDDYVEIAVTDTGRGMTEEQLSHLFDRTYKGGHGFGLLNCKGIIDKYKKLSKVFSGCQIKAESQQGRGSRISFTLPKGIVRLIIFLMLLPCSLPVFSWPNTNQSQTSSPMKESNFKREKVLIQKADAFADSAYFSNINGTYHQTLVFADSCLKYINQYYLRLHPRSRKLMVTSSSQAGLPAELIWFHDSVPMNYALILDIRNESAVAALALHQWQLYHYNNKVYTQLFREVSADNSLADYCRVMQKSENNKTVAIIILVLLLLFLFPAYYALYYRHRLYYRYCVDRINVINGILLGEKNTGEKLRLIDKAARELSADDISDHVRNLKAIVDQIREALKKGADDNIRQQISLDLAIDELRKVQYENDKLHVSNNVLDNCLSTLKHETIYYPSRIRQLLADGEAGLPALAEVVNYYKELYSMLSLQAMRQIDYAFLRDKNAVNVLEKLLKGLLHDSLLEEKRISRGRDYEQITLHSPSAKLSEMQCKHLFTSRTVDVQYLLCRQIVREIGETTNARGCGIMAQPCPEGGVNIEIILTKNIWKTLK